MTKRTLIYKRSLFLFWMWGAFSISLSAQHPSWVNYNSNDGLPGNEVYDMTVDSLGYLWCATNQGICHFNGYEFIRPVDTSLMRGGAAFIPTEDPKGRIWFTHIDHSIHFIEKDTVRDWAFNSLLDQYRGKFNFIEQLAIAGDGTVWLSLGNLGLLEVSPSGAHHLVLEDSMDFFVFKRVGEKVIYTASRALSSKKDPVNRDNSRYRFDVVEWKDEKAIPFENIFFYRYPGINVAGGVTPLRSGDLILFDAKSFRLVHDNRVQWEAPAVMEAEKVYESPDGHIFVTSHLGKNTGLFYYESLEQLRSGEYTNLLPGHFVTDFISDRSGGWWAATFDQGVYYCKNPGIDIFDVTTGLPFSDVTCLADDRKETIFAGFRPACIYSIDRRNGSSRPLPKPLVSSREIWTMYYDTLGERLGCSSPFQFLEKGSWRQIIYNGTGNIPAKKISSDPSGNLLWAGSTFGFYCIDRFKYTAIQLGGKSFAPERTFSVAPDREGNIWVATVHGLRLWKNDHYELPPFKHPVLKFEASDLKILPDGGMVISFNGAGVLIRDANGNFTHLTKVEGLTDDFISSLYLDGKGDIYACSNAGLNILHRDPGAWEISNITIKEGLPSNQVNGVTVLAGEIWVATNKGLARIRGVPTPGLMPEPVIEKIWVINREVQFTENMDLTYKQNNLTIRFYALDYSSGGNINYRYRLLGADSTFQQSHTREVNYANLPPGDYTFEVQAQNEVGQWGEPACQSFDIRPAWWQTNWFRTLLGILLFLAIVVFFQIRLRTVRRDTEIRNQIQELEAAALRAQMNPHFIFNCLSSIQEFIVENDPAAATRYLARFARLVRLALHGSVDGRHTLNEEVDMLDNYLALEQLRFSGKFIYEIKTAHTLESEEIQLPPMLVQPFVENAILHGMKNKTDGGHIVIAFSRIENQLVVTITDNGPGFSSVETTPRAYKSVGMTLTKHRLEILSGKAGVEPFLSENITNAEGGVIGSRVVLHIPIEQ